MNFCQVVRVIALSVLLPLLVCLGSFAQEPDPKPSQKADPSPVSASGVADQAFLKEAADGGLGEVELGQLAVEKASNPEVKQFAQRMMTDHGKANVELARLASKKGVDLPSEPGQKNKATKEQLSKLSGEEFDEAYMFAMLKAHNEDIAEFKAESANGTDSDVKQFASETLPTLQDHLKQAEKVAAKLPQSAANSPK